ncbi:hypothetical protein D8B26_002185 [Coccidioides posadasii str. Silveira]|uniref:Uncharacterized protein n=2 Tax=Coccidioides posadasii TaxID=199306 RepID=E9CVF3_COCPS|nr:Transcriptional Coactivator p15 family protein [Coccidioides posadasii C735 delta SOWgp]EER24016.1 Transcriptional Coactivator p15 family protein [Coccidioides posadasii C735 delta SOWgp]EFW22098.1 conserved hypothetical protein [Coccidioides posadasii str. Silveira]QVM07486.1 hypothetical protein D8B26_002185 [Coccidioides posadasii str. Silveira]|eukprot:XP_003066161.1 Transcriptional Coactivator p15 family protein [Coccidioides posadasii C735 delta SOWgp]
MATRKRRSAQNEISPGDSNSDEGHQRKKVKPATARPPTTTQEPNTDSNGDPYWEISRQRRVTVSTFKGRTMINVREYYEKDGQDLPGKKGISMTLEQFNALVSLLPGIEDVVRQKGGVIERPKYGDSGEETDEDMQVEKAETAKKIKISPEKNIEATSEESEGEN